MFAAHGVLGLQRRVDGVRHPLADHHQLTGQFFQGPPDRLRRLAGDRSIRLGQRRGRINLAVQQFCRPTDDLLVAAGKS